MDRHQPAMPVSPIEAKHSALPRRRWFQFSLRTLLIVMIAVGSLAGLVGIRLQRARRQHEAAVAIRRLEGTVEYSQAQGTPLVVRDLLEAQLGRDFFDSVVAVQVDLLPADTTEGQLAVWRSLADFPQLEQLAVDYPRRYPRSRFNIGPILRLERLETLKIRDAQIDGDDLKPLARMPALKTLDLSFCQIGDDAWPHVVAIEKLHTLDASYSFVTDAGTGQLARCRHLRHLVLKRAVITDRGAAELAKIAGLESLVLDGTRITDVALASLARLENLQTLSICETSVSDRGLAALESSTSLKSLTAERTNVSQEALRQFNNSRSPD